jgi:hypothetical protein
MPLLQNAKISDLDSERRAVAKKEKRLEAGLGGLHCRASLQQSIVNQKDKGE